MFEKARVAEIDMIDEIAHGAPTHRHGDHASHTDGFSDIAVINELHEPQIAITPIGDRSTLGDHEIVVAEVYAPFDA